MERQLSHSQNFLKSPERVLELLSRTSIRAGDTVYDIGAGTGTITEALRRKVCNVIAIEIDKGLYEGLQTRFQGSENVQLLLQDFLKYCLTRKGDYKIFSNIPFNLTADIIRKVTGVFRKNSSGLSSARKCVCKDSRRNCTRSIGRIQGAGG